MQKISIDREGFVSKEQALKGLQTEGSHPAQQIDQVLTPLNDMQVEDSPLKPVVSIPDEVHG